MFELEVQPLAEFTNSTLYRTSSVQGVKVSVKLVFAVLWYKLKPVPIGYSLNTLYCAAEPAGFGFEMAFQFTATLVGLVVACTKRVEIVSFAIF